jgi:hypothetical protein
MNKNENHSFLSGIYLINYKRVSRIVLPIIAICVTFSNIFTIYSDQSKHFGSFTIWVIIIGQTIAGTFLVYGIITFIFSILERYKALDNINNTKLQINYNLPYMKVITVLSILAGVIQIFGIILCLLIYYSGNEWLAGLGILIVAIAAIGLYIAIIIIWLKYSKNKKM